MTKPKHFHKVKRLAEILPHVSEGCAVREWRPYVVPKQMQDQIDRCRELMALPSRFAK